MQFTENSVIPIFTGPTASGKTALSIRAAQALDGEIISCDSMQVYRGLDIATAKPSPEEQAGIPHHLIDIMEPSATFSVSQYLDLATETLTNLTSRSIWPILVGGTPQYVTAIMEGIRFVPTDPDPELRRQLFERLETYGSEFLLAELSSLDPAKAASLHPNDHRRIIRGLEIAYTSGLKQSDWDQENSRKPLPWKFQAYAVDWPRDELYARINRRVDLMMEQGLLEEASQVFALDLPENASARQAIGYKEFSGYFNGCSTLAESVDLLKRNSRRYAKRQLTWFRHKPWIHWLTPTEADHFAEGLPANLVDDVVTK